MSAFRQVKATHESTPVLPAHKYASSIGISVWPLPPIAPHTDITTTSVHSMLCYRRHAANTMQHIQGSCKSKSMGATKGGAGIYILFVLQASRCGDGRLAIIFRLRTAEVAAKRHAWPQVEQELCILTQSSVTGKPSLLCCCLLQA